MAKADMPDINPFYAQPGLHTEIYDVAFWGRGGDPMDGDVEFYRSLADVHGGPVLELGCGTGRIAVPLASAGHDVTGLDQSPAMLARAAARRAAAGRDGDRLRLVEGDMGRFDLRRRFQLIIVAFRSFQALLHPQGQRAALDAIADHLLPGGRLVINLFDPRLDLLAHGTAPEEINSVIHPERGTTVTITITERTIDPLTQRLDEVWEFVETDTGGRVLGVEREQLQLRWTYRWEMRYLLQLAGYEVVAEYSDFHRSAPAYGGEQVWVACAR